MAHSREIDWLGKRLSVRHPLGEAEMSALAALPVTVREYDPGQYMVREGDRPKFCSALQKGFVFRHKIVGDGGRQIISIHVQGDFVDAQNMLLDRADHNIQALSHAVMLLLPIDEVMTLIAQYPDIARAMWCETLVESAIVREWVANIGRRDARSRTAHMLCELATRCEAEGVGTRETFDLPMTQEQLGDALGLTSVHVNRTLKTLESERLITRDKRSVTVANWQGLRSAGDFTPNYLHLPQSMTTAHNLAK